MAAQGVVAVVEVEKPDLRAGVLVHEPGTRRDQLIAQGIENIHRVGYVSGLVAQHGGTTLCSVISPYRAVRDEARKLSKGNFVEVFCDTPIDVCEQRDVKGLYAKARAGLIKGFTGVDDPYEPPLKPELTIDCATKSTQELVLELVRSEFEEGR